jgi:ATP-dependent Clp protease adapter protein ClpS
VTETRKVVLHNDKKTPYPFVLETMGMAFDLPGSKLLRITLATHLQGAAVVGEFPAREANVLSKLVCSLAEIRGWPLRATVEDADWAPGVEHAKAAGEPGPFVASIEKLADLAEQLEASSGGKSSIGFGRPLGTPGPGRTHIGLTTDDGMDITITIEKAPDSTEG